ncbi:uncharacterized protein LOC144094839 [Amblyomma americanum]
MRGSSWTQKTIQESLKIRLACGGRGYEYLRGNGWPLPAERTLQKHIEYIKFTPGRPTLHSSDPSAEPVLATHALVLMLGGIASRWKQTVAYHFTAESFDAAKVLDLLF